jgi:hypothetical protein
MNGVTARIGAAVLAAAAGMAFGQAPQYRVVLIPQVPGTPPGLLHSPVAVNDQNEAAGYFSSGANGYRTFYFRPGQGSVDIGAPAGMGVVLPNDITSAGVIVGEVAQDILTSATQPRPYSWQNGAMTLYPQLVSGRPAEVGLSNNAATVVGWANDGSFIGKFAVEYTPGQPVRLIPQVQGYNDAIDINNNGVVVGTSIDGLYQLFPDGSYIVLPAPGANLGATVRVMNDLRDVGGSVQATGHSEGSTAAVWFSDTGWTFLPPGGRRNVVTSLNNRREAVGNSQDNTGAVGDHGFYWSQATGRQLLQDLIVDPPGVYAVWLAYDINEVGTVAAVIADRASGQSFGALLVRTDGAAPCYANCDQSATPPVLNVQDFTCFLQKFGSGDAAANCDQSTPPPVLNVQDFTCFLQKFSAGCP